MLDFKYKLMNRKDVAFVDRILELKRESRDNYFAVMDFIIEEWIKRKPNEYHSFVIDIKDTKDSLYDKKFATAKKSKGSGSLRRSLDIPVFIDRMMRKTYSTDELPFNKEFYQRVWKRYPIFRVSDRN